MSQGGGQTLRTSDQLCWQATAYICKAGVPLRSGDLRDPEVRHPTSRHAPWPRGAYQEQQQRHMVVGCNCGAVKWQTETVGLRRARHGHGLCGCPAGPSCPYRAWGTTRTHRLLLVVQSSACWHPPLQDAHSAGHSNTTTPISNTNSCFVRQTAERASLRIGPSHLPLPEQAVQHDVRQRRAAPPQPG